MHGRNFAGHIAALLVVLIGVLIGCGVAPAPAPTPDPEGNGDPVLVNMPVAPLLETVSMGYVRTGTRADTAAEIKLSFAKSMNRDSVENAINLYPSGFKANTGTPKRLQIKAVCDSGWNIRNPNNAPVSFDWSISKSVERGQGMVAANGEQRLRTSLGFKQLRVSVNGALHARVLSATGSCEKTLEFAWSEDNKSLTVKALKPISSDALTVALSTAAFSSDGVRLESPSNETLVPEQIVQVNQAVTLQFSQAINKANLEESLKVYQGKFDAYESLESTAPRVTNSCDGSYTIKNSGSAALKFTWTVEGSTERGAGQVDAASETKITPISARAVKVFTEKGANITRTLEGSQACVAAFTPAWNDSSTALNLTPKPTWKLGSFTVTGNAVNSSGVKVARDLLAVFHAMQDDSSGGGGSGGGSGGGDNIEPEPLLRADVDKETFPIVATAGEPTIFSGVASGSSLDDPNLAEPSVSWEFGDGSSATGADVEHTYADPGEYRVTTRVTNSSGISDSVTQNVQVLPSAEQIIAETHLTNGNDTFDWDFGNPIPGLQYDVSFSDNKKQIIATSTATRGAQRFERLGAYSMRVSIMDYRDDPTRAKAKRTTNPEEILERTLIQRDVRLNRWELQPIPSFKAISSNISTESAWREQLVGEAPFIVDFDGSESQGESLTYTWRSCQIVEGACDPISEKTGVRPRFGFLEPGEYEVELTITDRFGQQATQQTYVIAKTRDMNFMTPRFDFSTAPGYDNLIGGNSIVTTGVNPIPGDIGGVPTGEAYFPFVMHRSVKFNRTGIRWNSWDRGNIFRRQKCVSIKGYHNGREFYPNKFLSPDVVPDIPPSPDLQDYLNYSVLYDPNATYGLTIPECDLVTMNNRDIPRVNAGSNQEIVVSGNSFIQRLHFDVPADFRVPKLVLAVLPDDMVPGDANMPGAATKMVNEHTIELFGRKQLVLTVVMRASEVQRLNRKLEFDVPVYAVDTEGRAMSNVNGFFFAKFNNVESNCGVCVMVDGKAKIHVSINPALYGVRDGQALNTVDLSVMTLSSDDQRCDGSNNESAIGKKLRLGLLGCAFIATSSYAPIGEETLEPIDYWGLENNTSFGGNVYFGDYANAVENFRQFFSETLPDEIGELVIGQIPIYGIGRAFVKGWVYCRDNGCNFLQWGGVFLAGAGLALELTPIVKTVFKLAERAYLYSLRVGGGQFARALNDVIEPLAIVGKSASEIGMHLRTNFGTLIEALGKCVALCGKSVDKLLELYKREGIESSVALHEIDELLVTAKNSRIRESDILDLANFYSSFCSSIGGIVRAKPNPAACSPRLAIQKLTEVIGWTESALRDLGVSNKISVNNLIRRMKQLANSDVLGKEEIFKAINQAGRPENIRGFVAELIHVTDYLPRSSLKIIEIGGKFKTSIAREADLDVLLEAGRGIDKRLIGEQVKSSVEGIRKFVLAENASGITQAQALLQWALETGSKARVVIFNKYTIDSPNLLPGLVNQIRNICGKSLRNPGETICLDVVDRFGTRIHI
jgi:PKD domain